MRIVIPTEDSNGLDAKLSMHFGRANFFAVIDLNDEVRIRFEKNTGEHFGGRRKASQIILEFKPDVVITHGIGAGAIEKFKGRVKVYKAQGKTIRDAISAFKLGKLQPITEAGCEEGV